MLLTAFTETNYTRHVWMVEPTYFLACMIFENAGFRGRLRGVPEDDEGIDIEFLRSRLLAAKDGYMKRPESNGSASSSKMYRHVIYAVPTFSNPSGKVMSLRRRRQLLELARKFDALIICDDVYDWLRWPAAETERDDTDLPPPLPRLVDIDRALPGGTEWGNAVSNGSFSKIVGPGVRVGWVDGSPAVVSQLCKLGVIKSGGSQAHLTSMIIGRLLSSGDLERHIGGTLIPTYRRRYHVMLRAIEEQLLPLGITTALLGGKNGEVVTSPTVVGGFFIWLNFPGTSVSAERVAKLALEHHDLRVAHGGMMTVAGDGECAKRAERGFGMGVRLCWAWHTEDEIKEGIGRLAMAFEEAQRGFIDRAE